MNAHENELTIEVSGLTKRYGYLTAVDGIDFEVATGEVFCLLGPNGAGKTTTMECLEGLRKPDSGRIRVLGMDPLEQHQRLQRRIGVQLQEASLPARIRVWEALAPVLCPVRDGSSPLGSCSHGSASRRSRTPTSTSSQEARNSAFSSPWR